MTYLFINPQNEYPRFAGDILLDYPDFDGTNIPEGWIPVEDTQPPTWNEGEIIEELFPQLIDGKYKRVWNVRTLTAQEIETLYQSQPLA